MTANHDQAPEELPGKLAERGNRSGGRFNGLYPAVAFTMKLKWLFAFPGSAVLALILIVTASDKARAADFALSLTAEPNPVVVSNTVTYTLSAANVSGRRLTNVRITNTLPDSVQFQGATNPFPVAGSINFQDSRLTMLIRSFPVGTTAGLRITGVPTGLGLITNSASITEFNVGTVATNVVTEVVSAETDLQTGISGAFEGIFINDWVIYDLMVTNRGPNAVPGVTLTNRLPADTELIGVLPEDADFELSDGLVRFELGTLANGGSAEFQLTVQPTNAGSLSISAGVGAPGLTDTNLDNNAVTNRFEVEPFLSGQLEARIDSPQAFNPQTGLVEQWVELTNTGTQSVASARVTVADLPARLFNAVGTNDSHGFVVYGDRLDPGESVELLLEYFIPEREPVDDPTLTAIEVPKVDLSAPESSPPNITRVLPLATGRLLIEFASVPGRTYQILYSNNMDFTDARVARPVIVAPADRVQWIDDGPPKTVNRLTRGGSRFYRVMEVQ